MADWATISSMATAGGTLVLAAATFASVRSANRAARISERSLRLNLRPVLVPARPEDPPEIIPFPERNFQLPGGRGLVEEHDGNVFLGLTLRNMGSGLAVLQGGHVRATGDFVGRDVPHVGLDEFRLMQRDLYVPAGGTGYWHAGVREDNPDLRRDLLMAARERQRIIIELLYGDFEGEQRTVTRFAVTPAGESKWLAIVLRHWGIDE